ncbi:MAG: DUF308 domain-containing protein [Enterococcus lemanii]|jgi:uncharacterized membrane protein HdeD (DUF308 family)
MLSRVLESEAWVRQLFFLLFGLYLIIFPNLGLNLILQAVVILCFVLGAFNVLKYFLGVNKKKKGYTSHMMIGLIQLGVGGILYFNLDRAATISIYLFALFLFFDAALELKDYLKQTAKNNLYAKIVLLLIVLNAGLAVILVASPFHFLASQPIIIGLALMVINGIELYKTKYLKKEI